MRAIFSAVRLRRRSLQAVPALAGLPQPEPGAGAGDHHGHQDPADQRAERPPEDVVEDDLVVERGVADADERPAEDDDRHALQDQQPAESDDERRHPQPGHERSLDEADRGAREQRHDDRRPPRPVRAGRLHELGHHDAAEPHDQADGQVDLSEQQGEDLSHRQQHVHGALLEEVDQVLRRQELRVRDLEADGDHHEAQDDRQDAAVTTADPDATRPGSTAPSVWAMSSARDIGRGDLGVEGQVGRHRAGRPGRGLAVVRAHGHFLIACPSLVLPRGQTRVTLPAPRRDSTSISTAARSTPPGRMYSSGVDSEPRLSRDTP